MAIVWGSIYGDYAKAGIETILSNTNTQTTVTVNLWVWTKYSMDETYNTLYFDNLSASGSATTNEGSVSIQTSVNTGSGWSESNKVKVKTFTYTYTRGTSAQKRYLYAKFTDIIRAGTMYASTTFTVPALASYTVAYNANGGSGAPSSQTKWYGKSLTLSSTKPTRTGYTFQGWATSASGGVAYAAGASYTANAGATLYAIWKANTYTVSYNANGGTNAPPNQTKTYGVALTLSSTKPTRANYNFKGWGTSASATTVSYAAGANYTANAAVTLYAIWELAYTKPRITNMSVARCNSAGTVTTDGTYALVSFKWACDKTLSSIVIDWASGTETGSYTVTASGTSGNVSVKIGEGSFNTELSYTITVTVTDSIDKSDASKTLNSQKFAIDALPENKGVAFGKTAELENTAEFAYDAKFNNPVYGKALGLDRLPAIPENSDLNNYLTTGCFAVQSNAIADTCSNIPVARAGRLEVWASTGEGIRPEQWSYLRQRFIPYNSSNAVWERDITRGENNVWTFYDWFRSSLDIELSDKIYNKSAITIGLTANSTLSVKQTYTKIPFNEKVISLGSKLSLSSNSVLIGSNISHVKVNAQIQIKSGSTAGIRHFRIQKLSKGTTTSWAWSSLTSDASVNASYNLTPIIIPVTEGDLLFCVYYTSDTEDYIVAGSTANGKQSYLTVEEL